MFKELGMNNFAVFPDGKPTGSIRISFGHYSSIKDADFVIQLIKDHFVNNKPTKGT